VIPPNIEPFGMGWLRKWKKKKKAGELEEDLLV